MWLQVSFLKSQVSTPGTVFLLGQMLNRNNLCEQTHPKLEQAECCK